VHKIAIIENSNGLGNYFTKFLDTKQYELFHVWKNYKLPDKNFYSYIFTGDFNNISDGLLPIHRKEIEFVKSIIDKRIFGSCFFHQLIGSSFGGSVKKRENRFIGWQKMVIKKHHQIFNGLTESYFLNMNIDEIVTPPPTAKILAINPGCEYQVLQYGENILTFQSHPEIYKQEGLDLIKEQRNGLLINCPNLDKIVNQTKDFANDDSNEIFMSNLTAWLLD
jgi:GMP synthase-like glutamine amidotransferase